MPELVSLESISDHHTDIEASLRLNFSSSNPSFSTRFFGYKQSEIDAELETRLAEAELRSALIALARVEAALRIDYVDRAQSKFPDVFSQEFRKTFKAKNRNARLDEDILATWSKHLTHPDRTTINDLRRMLPYRHWLAHGQYWQFGEPHSFDDIYFVAQGVVRILDSY